MKIGVVTVIGIVFILNSASIGIACTGFTASDDELVIVGANEDHYTYTRWIDVYPPEEGKYGKVLFGHHNWYTQGMNDQGLFWDGYSCPYLEVTKGEGLEPIPDPGYLFNVVISETCATIYDVIELLDSHDIRDLPIEVQQVLFVDANGDSVIFEGDNYIFKEGSYQAVTNFYQSHPELGGEGFDRYETAINMLEEMTVLSMEYFRDICDATHLEGSYPDYRTIHSLVLDLTNDVINYYYDYNYNEVWEINFTELFEYGRRTYDVSKLFNNNNPNKPMRPNGIRNGKPGGDYTFDVTTRDRDGDQIYYKWDWGDGNVSDWLGPYDSNMKCQVSHTWLEKGQYNVKVMARDTNCGKSDWSNPLGVSMPKKIQIIMSLSDLLQEHYPRIFSLFKYYFRK